MTGQLRILMIEDSPADASFITNSLRAGGLAFSLKVVETKAEFCQELERNRPDLIISDHGLPGFDGFAALALAREQVPEAPFIFVTGATGEEIVIDALRRGATNCVLKDRSMKRLVPAIRRALDPAEGRFTPRQGAEAIHRVPTSQAAMRHSEIRYRRLFETARDGVLLLDPLTRKIVDANPFMTELLGYTREELRGKELFEIGLLKDHASSEAAFQELQAHGSIRYEDLPLETKTGERREVEFVSNLYQENGGKIIQCNIRDITERKNIERALSEQARLLDLSNDAIILHDSEGRILYWNHGAEELFGWPREDALGKDIHFLLQTEPPKPLHQINDDLFQNGHWTGQMVQTKRDGQRITVLARKVLDYDPQRKLTRVLESMTDITERVRMNKELRAAKDALAGEASRLEEMVAERTAELTAANKQLHALVYTVAHDLRAPMRAIQGFSAMLVEEAGAALSGSGRDLAHRIGRSAQFMDALLRGLLAFNEIDQQRIELISIRLETVVRSVLSGLENEIEEKHARVEIAGLWPSVRAHEPTLGQVLSHLLSNALKFLPPDRLPQIRLRAEKQGPMVRVWVEDNGIGIAAEHRDQIFRLFTRLNGDRYSGTGTGLAVVQKAVERMGGRVGVQSTPGQGSHFWFELRKP